jgi:ribA/ribD-fused uncharacterized protein
MLSETNVFFWKPPSVFSQWTPSKFVIDNIEYCCAEQYMMSQKAKVFEDITILNQIMATSDPRKHRELGRKISNYNDKVWNNVSLYIVIEGNKYKFYQNPDMLKKLLQTENKTLVEASPFDKIWGIGMAQNNKNILDETKWGQNKLGIALMRVRELLADA